MCILPWPAGRAPVDAGWPEPSLRAGTIGGVSRRDEGGSVLRIVDRPEHHEAPGACDWDGGARRRRDATAVHAARRFLRSGEAAGEECWRCEAAEADSPLGLCRSCRDELRTT